MDLKRKRRGTISIFLSFILLITSCSQYNSEFEESYSLESYVEKHIEISNRLVSIVKNENSINIEMLKDVETYETFRETLINAGFEEYDEIIQLAYQMETNSKKFARTNPYLKNYNINELELLIGEEINEQLILENNIHRSGPCEDVWDAAADACLENFIISAGATIVSGFFSFGIGTVFGGMTAFMLYVKCTSEANRNYYACLDQ